MTKAFAIVDRQTGEFYRGHFKIYKTEATAKGVLTSQGHDYAPGFAYTVVEMELNILGAVDQHKLTEKQFNDMMDDERDRLDEKAAKTGKSGYSMSGDWHTFEKDRAKRFWNRYKDMKYV